MKRKLKLQSDYWQFSKELYFSDLFSEFQVLSAIHYRMLAFVSWTMERPLWKEPSFAAKF